VCLSVTPWLLCSVILAGSSRIPETGNFCLRTTTLGDSTVIFTVNSATRVCSARDSISSCARNLTSRKFVQNRSRVMVRVVWSFSQSSAIVYSLAVGSTKSPLTSTPYPVDQTHALINAQQTVERRRQKGDGRPEVSFAGNYSKFDIGAELTVAARIGLLSSCDSSIFTACLARRQ